MTIKEVYERSRTSEKTVTSLITKGEKSSLIAIGLGKGIILKEHTAPGPTKLIVIKGAIEYTTAVSRTKLTALDEFDIPLEETHSIKAAEHSLFLLSVNK